MNVLIAILLILVFAVLVVFALIGALAVMFHKAWPDWFDEEEGTN